MTVVAGVMTAAIVAAVFFGAVLVACLAAVAGFAQALAKLSLDALIQRDVPELVRTSAFARSETLLQMAWVFGGAIGIVMPLNGTLGLSVGAAIVAAGWLTTVRGLVASARHGGRRGRGWRRGRCLPVGGVRAVPRAPVGGGSVAAFPRPCGGWCACSAGVTNRARRPPRGRWGAGAR
ncbi:hypothetical protein GCM10020256_43010 [Streptomyces thermocoprophilus]